jgi:hypothetical protein
VLIPYLSLQVRLSLSKHIYKELDKERKVEIVRESFLDSILNDITDIAILQEVIQRSQAGVYILENTSPPPPGRGKYQPMSFGEKI